ncbi:MAG: hypothetical protein ABI661_03775, partial [Gammaproteobacteria bacterium]
MNARLRSALLAVLAVGSGLGAGLGLPGCAQMTTNRTEQAALDATAERAGAEYLACLDQAASRYLATGEGAEAIVRVTRKDCSATRDRAASAQEALLGARYILAEPQVAAAVKALDDKGEAA